MSAPKPAAAAPAAGTTYWDYLKIDALLRLQNGKAADERELSDDELRFIVVHQVDELWFKLALRELTTVRDVFRQQHVPETALGATAAALRRVTLLFDLAANHFRLMETMRTQDYLRFRDELAGASGFQSAQLREIEILLGLGEEERIEFGGPDGWRRALLQPDGAPSPSHARVVARQADRPTVKEAVYGWLHRTPIDGSSPGMPGDDAVVQRFLDAYLERHEQSSRRAMQTALRIAADEGERAQVAARYERELRSARAYLTGTGEEALAGAAADAFTRRIRAAILFIESHRDLPLLSWPGEIVALLLEVEQSMLIFRQRHARMVERVIGRRVGTGGSQGVDYLDQTALRYRIFKEIWAARTLLLDPRNVPPLANADYYGLRAP